jgi:hypothetical protein
MKDRIEQLKDLMDEAGANGWVSVLGWVNERIAVSRTTRHETPEFAKRAGWWAADEYRKVECLVFSFHRRDRVPTVTYTVIPASWSSPEPTTVSFKRALELLAQPVAESRVLN